MVGDATVGQSLLEESLTYARTVQDDAIVGEAAVRLGPLTLSRGDYAAARRLFEESLATHRRAGNREQVVKNLFFLALVLIYQGEFVAAQTILEEGYAEARTIGYRHWAAATLGELGLVAMSQGDHRAARRQLEESLRLFGDSMDWVEVSSVQNYLAGLGSREGHFAAAHAGYAASLALSRPARFIFHIAKSLDGLAILAARKGQMERALRLAGASAALRETAGYQAPPAEREELDLALAGARRALGDAAAAAAWAAG